MKADDGRQRCPRRGSLPSAQRAPLLLHVAPCFRPRPTPVSPAPPPHRPIHTAPCRTPNSCHTSPDGSLTLPLSAALCAETRCPASNQPLRLRDLVPVKFTPVPEEEASASGSGGEGGAVHMDPITRESFGVASRIVVLAATGDAMLKETYKKCVKPEGRYNGRPPAATSGKTGG